jgi:CubicO group peptidase (beta-lactamase class C family)
VEAGAPGAIALIRTGQRTWPEVGGLGDLHARHPARPADRFRIGSVTKSFVATVVLQLAGEGRLGLDDSLQRWLPGAVPGGENFTIRQLLNHTSGLHDYTDDLLPRLTAMPARQALRQMAARNYQPQQLWPSPPAIRRCSPRVSGSPTATPTPVHRRFSRSPEPWAELWVLLPSSTRVG